MNTSCIPAWLVARPYAHRGLHNIRVGIPENSLPAFRRALEQNYSIELDVQLLRDQQLVVFHDATLRRMCQRPGRLGQLDQKQAKQLRLLHTPHHIPLLADVLDLIADRVPVLIEVKNWGLPGKLERTLVTLLARYPGRFAIQSFNPLVVAWFACHAPHICRGQLASDFRTIAPAWLPTRWLSRLLLQGYGAPHFVAYESCALPRAAVAHLRARATPILAWTVTSAAEQARLRAYSDAIIFEKFAA